MWLWLFQLTLETRTSIVTRALKFSKQKASKSDAPGYDIKVIVSLCLVLQLLASLRY